MSTRSYPFAACFAFPFVSAILFFFAFSRTEHSVDSIRLCADIFSHWIGCLVPNGAVDAPPKNMRTDAHLFDAVYWIYNCRVCRTFVEIELYYSPLPRARYAAVATDNDFRWCCVCSTPAKWRCCSCSATYSIVDETMTLVHCPTGSDQIISDLSPSTARVCDGADILMIFITSHSVLRPNIRRWINSHLALDTFASFFHIYRFGFTTVICVALWCA